jgi:hypothetical protein
MFLDKRRKITQDRADDLDKLKADVKVLQLSQMEAMYLRSSSCHPCPKARLGGRAKWPAQSTSVDHHGCRCELIVSTSIIHSLNE